LLALGPGSVAAQAPSVPAPPYYSVQVGTAPTRAAALEQVRAYGDEPQARAERRRSGWQIRVGAWRERADAEGALTRLRARGAKQARVLQMETAVAWLLPDGTTVQPGAPGAVSATAAPAAAAEGAVSQEAPAASREAPVFIPPPPPPPAIAVASDLKLPAEYRAAAAKLDTEIRRWLLAEGTVRRDGYLYALDVAPLLLYAAQRGDQALYQRLLPEARKLVLDDRSDPFTRGFVVVRARPGVKPDVTGATEALWLARALWQGATTFNRGDDRALALTVLEGYARHAYELQGVWLIRKYFAFEGRAFGGLSALANYHPDFMTDLEQQVPRGEWRGFAERSHAALERARAPSGLLYPLIQPEVGATYPELNVVAYAPNAQAPLAESCFGAAGAVRGNPKLADALLGFARERGHQTRADRLYAYFNTHTGERGLRVPGLAGRRPQRPPRLRRPAAGPAAGDDGRDQRAERPDRAAAGWRAPAADGPCGRSVQPLTGAGAAVMAR
jgi:hypothetical protein